LYKEGLIVQLVKVKSETKQIIGYALLELCKSKPISKITVQELADRSGICRKTFYNHFKDKFDLAVWVFEFMCDSIIKDYAQHEPWGVVLGRIYRFMFENSRAFGNQWDEQELRYLIEGMNLYIQKYYERTIIELHGPDVLTQELLFANLYNSYGALNIVLDWIKGKITITPEELGLNMAAAMPPLLRKFVDRYECSKP
jgi:AcrR family transcriptional regulator